MTKDFPYDMNDSYIKVLYIQSTQKRNNAAIATKGQFYENKGTFTGSKVESTSFDRISNWR